MSGRLAPARLAVWGAGALALLALIAVGLLALSPPYAGLDGGLRPTLDSLQGVARTYLLRTAVINTLTLAVGTSAVSLLVARFWLRAPIGRAGRSLYFLPLLLPGATAGLLWEPLLAGNLALASAPLNLTLTGLVVVWRATPAAVLLLESRDDSAVTQRQRPWIPAAALAPLLVLTDAGLVLALTGGEPFNAAQTWPSWLLLTLWTHGSWGHGAVIGAGLSLATTGVAAAAAWRLRPRAPRPEERKAAPPRHAWLGLEIAGVWCLVPFIPAVAQFAAAPLAGLLGLWQAGLFNWIGLWALLAGVAGMAVAWLMRPWMQASGARPGPGAALMALAVGWLPLWTVALAYLRHALPGLGGVWTLAVPLIVTGAALGIGWTLRMGVPARGEPLWRTGLALALLLLAHSFSLALVLDLPVMASLPAVGTAQVLAHAAPAVLSGALLVQGAMAWGAAWVVLRSHMERGHMGREIP